MDGTKVHPQFHLEAESAKNGNNYGRTNASLPNPKNASLQAGKSSQALSAGALSKSASKGQDLSA